MAVDPEIPAAHLLQFNRRQRQRSPPAGRPCLNLGYFCGFGIEAHFVYDDHRHAIEQVATAPGEIDGDVVFLVVEVNPPKGLRDEVLDSKVPIDNES